MGEMNLNSDLRSTANGRPTNVQRGLAEPSIRDAEQSPADWYRLKVPRPKGKTRLEQFLQLFRHEDVPTNATSAMQDQQSRMRRENQPKAGSLEDAPKTKKGAATVPLPIPKKYW